MNHKVHHPVAVAEFNVILGNELDEVVIEGGGVGVTVKVSGDNLVLSIA